MQCKTLLFFRLISFLEGLSYLLVLFVAMPLKYLANERAFMSVVGMGHGVLFILFCISLYILSKKYTLSREKTADYFVYSLSPFAFLLIEKLLKKDCVQK